MRLIDLNKWTVYKHTLPSGKVYIGITELSPTERWSNGFGYKGQRKFFNQIVKYGWDNIKHEIIETGVSEDTARLLEKNLIIEEKDNAINTQHKVCRWEDSWTRQVVCCDDIYDRKIKFREMNDSWLDKVRHKDTIPYDWEICDNHIDFKYAIDGRDDVCLDVIRVQIPNAVTYVGLYDYLQREMDFSCSQKVSHSIVNRDVFKHLWNVANSLASAERHGII